MEDNISTHHTIFSYNLCHMHATHMEEDKPGREKESEMTDLNPTFHQVKRYYSRVGQPTAQNPSKSTYGIIFSRPELAAILVPCTDTQRVEMRAGSRAKSHQRSVRHWHTSVASPASPGRQGY